MHISTVNEMDFSYRVSDIKMIFFQVTTYFVSPDTNLNKVRVPYSEVPNRRACSLRFFKFAFHPARNFPPCSFIILLSKMKNSTLLVY